VKIGSIVGLALFGLFGPAPARPDYAAPLPGGGLMAAFGVAMIAVLWSYDGWYGFTPLAGEAKDPQRTIPRGLIGGTAVITALYVLMNLLYVRVLTIEEMSGAARIGEAAAAVLFGPWGARIISAAVVVSTFGCLSSTILYAARIYLPMAQDGLFFRSLAAVHPKALVPVGCLLAQGAWAIAQTFSGSYEQLYTYVVFALFVFHAATGAAVLVLRRTRPELPRPYRTWGYPWVPFLFIGWSLVFVVNTLVSKPVESGIGLAMVGLGVPAYLGWRRRTPGHPSP
jgi:APA family basic amino acid/polyamine antiporter